MKKRALGLTDIAIPSVPYETGKISDDNYEKSIVFFGKDTLDSGNPNSQPNINQIFDKEPHQPSDKEKIMKKKRFLKIKSLKKMASSDEKDQKTIEALKQNFVQIDKKVKETFQQKTSEGSLRRNLALYKRGGKIWGFVYKLAAEASLSSVFAKIDTYFTENISKALPKIVVFDSKGKINYKGFVTSSSTFDGSKNLNLVFDQAFYDSGDVISEQELNDSAKIRSDIIKGVISDSSFFDNKTLKIAYIDDILSKNINLSELPQNLLKAINEYYTTGTIDSSYRPMAGGKPAAPLQSVKNLEIIYQKMMAKIAVSDGLTARISEINRNTGLIDNFKARLERNLSAFGGDSSSSSLYAKKYLDLLKEVYSLQNDGNKEEILRYFDQMDQKITDYAENFAKEMVGKKDIRTYVSSPEDPASVREVIKESLFSPKTGFESLPLKRQYDQLSKDGTLTNTPKKSRGPKKTTSEAAPSTPPSPETKPKNSSPTSTESSEGIKPVSMTSVFDLELEETTTDDEPKAESATESTTKPTAGDDSVEQERLKNINDVEKFLEELINTAEKRKFISADEIATIRREVKESFESFRSEGTSMVTLQKVKDDSANLDKLYNDYVKIIDEIHEGGFNDPSDPSQTKENVLKVLNKDLDLAKINSNPDYFEQKYGGLGDFLQEAKDRVTKERLEAEEEKTRIEAQEKENEATRLKDQAKIDAQNNNFDEALRKIQEAQTLLKEREALLKESYDKKLEILEKETETQRQKLKQAAEKEAAGFRDQAESLRREAQDAKDSADQLRQELKDSKQETEKLIAEGKESATRLSEIEAKLTELQSRVTTADPETIRLELGEAHPRDSASLVPDAPRGRLAGAKNFAVALALFGTIMYFGLKSGDISDESAKEDFISGLLEALNKTYLYDQDEFSTAAINSIKENNDQTFNSYITSLRAEFKKSLVSVGFTERPEDETALSTGQSLSIFERGVTTRGVPLISGEGLTVNGRSNELSSAISRLDLVIEMLQAAYNEVKKDYYSGSTANNSDPRSSALNEPKRTIITVPTEDPLDTDKEGLSSRLTQDLPQSDWDDYSEQVSSSGYEIPNISGKFGIKAMWECASGTMRDYNNTYDSYKKYVSNVFGSTHDPELVFKKLKQICDAKSGFAATPGVISGTSKPRNTSSPEVEPIRVVERKPITNLGEITRGKYYHIDGAEVAGIIEPIKSGLSKKGGGKAVSLKMNIHSTHQMSVPKDPRMLRKVPFVIEKISIRYGAINPFEINYFYDTPDFISIIKVLLSEENVGKIKLS